MEKEIFVSIQIENKNIFVGHLWTRQRNGRESATFEYAKEWLKHPNRFAIEPNLMLFPGPHHTPNKNTIFGSLGD